MNIELNKRFLKECNVRLLTVLLIATATLLLAPSTILIMLCSVFVIAHTFLVAYSIRNLVTSIQNDVKYYLIVVIMDWIVVGLTCMIVITAATSLIISL